MRQRIESERWKQGEKISTIEELETEFGVARVTIRQAIEILREEGLLDARQGRGTFVSGRPKDKHWFNLANDLESVVSSIKNNVIRIVHIEENAEAPSLEENEGRPASGYILLRSVQFSDGEPFVVVNLHLARDIFVRDRKRFTRQPALPRILEMRDIALAHAFQTVTIGVADPETSELLEIGLGEPTADCRLVLVDDAGVALYVAKYNYHRNSFALRRDLLPRPKAAKAARARKKSKSR
ncbi:GntR family transcriptional regulator [Pseudolabrys taiwanensis]|nr:GntR family transcriptional regulator [Pseudolabrys taiwanensis]